MSKAPQPKLSSTQVCVRFPSDDIVALDAWIAEQPDPKPNRPEAVRRILAGRVTPPAQPETVYLLLIGRSAALYTTYLNIAQDLAEIYGTDLWQKEVSRHTARGQVPYLTRLEGLTLRSRTLQWKEEFNGWTAVLSPVVYRIEKLNWGVTPPPPRPHTSDSE